MKPLNLLLYLLVAAAVTATGMQVFADRLYTWTDEKGVSHITKDPPPASAKRKSVVEYSHRTHAEQKAAAGRQQQGSLEREANEALRESSGSVEQYREKIRKDLQTQAAEGKFTCYIQAPGRKVYVRIHSTNSRGERQERIFGAWIEPNQQALVISPTEQIIYSRKWEEKGPFGGDNQRACSGGGVIRLPGS